MKEFQFIDRDGKLRTTMAPRDIIDRLHAEADRYDRERNYRNERTRFEQPSYRSSTGQYDSPRRPPKPPSSDPFADLHDLFSNLGGNFDAFARAEREQQQRAEEERKRRAREEEAKKQQPKKPNGGKFTSVSAWVRLCTIAGVEETTPRSEKAKIIRKAQRKCHPDTGGSHDEWIMLEDILKSV